MISPDEELNPGRQRQAVALTHVECRGHHGAQSLGTETVGAEAVGMETMVRRPPKWRKSATNWGSKSRRA